MQQGIKKEGITQSFHPAFVSTPPFILESNFDYIFGAKLLLTALKSSVSF